MWNATRCCHFVLFDSTFPPASRPHHVHITSTLTSPVLVSCSPRGQRRAVSLLERGSVDQASALQNLRAYSSVIMSGIEAVIQTSTTTHSTPWKAVDRRVTTASLSLTCCVSAFSRSLSAANRLGSCSPALSVWASSFSSTNHSPTHVPTPHSPTTPTRCQRRPVNSSRGVSRLQRNSSLLSHCVTSSCSARHVTSPYYTSASVL